MGKPVIILIFALLLFSGCEKQYDHEHGDDDYVETAYFDASGGEYTYANGISLYVPPGALSDGKDIYIRDIKNDEKTVLLDIRAVTEQDILFAFMGGPDDIQFAIPAIVTVPVRNLLRDTVPLVHTFDIESRKASVADISYRTKPADETITLSIDHFSGYEGEIVDEIKRNECTDPSNTTCRCGQIEVSQTDINYSCSRLDCQVVYSENIVRFLDCPGIPEESSIFEEVSSGCTPELVMEVDKVYIEPGEQCAVTARIKLGCAVPVNTATIVFSAAGPGTLSPRTGSTDSMGEVHTEVTATGEEGKIVVTAETDFTYSVKRINVNGQDLVNEQRTVHLSESINVYVVVRPVLTLDALDRTISTNDSTIIMASLLYHETPVQGERIYFSVNGPASIDPSSFVTLEDGTAFTFLESRNVEGTAVITARSDVAVMLPGGEMVIYPVSESVDVLIKEEDDLDGTVWQFESVKEISTRFNPQGCEDVYIRPDCTCDGDYTGIMQTETIFQVITGTFSLSRTYGNLYTITVSNVSGSMHVTYPSSQYTETCPLGGGFGVPGCACIDPDFIRIDAWGVDAVNETITFSSPLPAEDEIEMYATVSDNMLWLYFKAPPEPEPSIEYRSWSSRYSDCECIEWTGERNYSSRAGWGFYSFSWEGAIENGGWTETDTSYETEEVHTFSLECTTGCAD
ncbi:MAG: hypothetical protein JW881_06005 [Spirochaetales bacterium]|nr:hypothetical protein [Spirochaetales bacterium]